jgi:hypothetical protein
MTHVIKFGPQKLSELIANKHDATGSYYGVEVDNFFSNPIKGADRVSFVAALDDPSSLSFDLMDTLIQYHQAKVDTLLEVPFDFPLPPPMVLVIANSINCGIVIAPPAEKTAENWATWKNHVLSYAKAMFGLPSFSKEILPVTSYVQYMAMQVMGYTPEGLTDDAMMHEYFEKNMDVVTMDNLKADLHDVVLEGHGGKEGFETVVQSTLSALNDVIVEEGRNFLASLTDCLKSDSEERLQMFLTDMLGHYAKDAVSEELVQVVTQILLNSKDAKEVEAKLLLETSRHTQAEVEAVGKLVDLVRVALN